MGNLDKLMTWTDLTADWGVWYRRMKTRFPHLDDSAMDIGRQDRARFEAHLAQVHNLSPTEAREEIDDFLYIESLTREISDSAK